MEYSGKLCRICLDKQSDFAPIVGFQSEMQELRAKMKMCLSIKVEENDTKPKQICTACISKLNMFFEFRQLALTSEKSHDMQYERIRNKMSENVRYIVMYYMLFFIFECSSSGK